MLNLKEQLKNQKTKTTGNEEIDKILNWKHIAVVSYISFLGETMAVNKGNPHLQASKKNKNSYFRGRITDNDPRDYRNYVYITEINSATEKLAYLLGKKIIYQSIPENFMEYNKERNVLTISNVSFFADDITNLYSAQLGAIFFYNCEIFGDLGNHQYIHENVLNFNTTKTFVSCTLHNNVSKKQIIEQ
jgi:hypothetical protein